jgi:TonB family protein
MLNGAIVSEEMALEAAKNDPEGVMIVAYLKDNHRVCAAVTTSGNYITGTIKPLQINLTEMESKPKNKKEPVPFHQVAQTPTFNGGDANEFSKWVSENFKYPDEARQSKVQGRVTVQFTVTEIGEVTDVKVLRGVNEILDKEAIRIVSQSPKWTPGRDENGEIVPVSYVFPVIFKL